MSRSQWISVFVSSSVLIFGAGCGPLDDFELGPSSGRVCYTDDECVPDDCCGNGSRAVHIDDAQSCAGVSCSGSCPRDMVDCGCGLPVCRNQRCQVAVTIGGGCG